MYHILINIYSSLFYTFVNLDYFYRYTRHWNLVIQLCVYVCIGHTTWSCCGFIFHFKNAVWCWSLNFFSWCCIKTKQWSFIYLLLFIYKIFNEENMLLLVVNIKHSLCYCRLEMIFIIICIIGLFWISFLKSDFFLENLKKDQLSLYWQINQIM